MATGKTKKKVCIKCGAAFETQPYGHFRLLCEKCSIKKDLVCAECGNHFIFFGRTSAKYCIGCRSKKSSAMTMLSRAKRDPTVKIGVGSGGNQLGESNPSWNPDSPYRGIHVDNISARKICYATYQKACFICGDSMRKVHVHHIDGDWTNNNVNNLMPLCCLCHKRVHTDVIRGAYTTLEESLISKIGMPKQNR
jgi:hypothetical protein